MTYNALLAARVLSESDLGLRPGPPGHRFMTQRAQLSRIGGNGQFPLLRMALGCAVTHFAAHRRVVIGRPLRVPFTMAALAITRRLENGFLGGHFGDRISTVVPVLIKRLGGEKPFRDQRYCTASDEKND